MSLRDANNKIDLTRTVDIINQIRSFLNYMLILKYYIVNLFEQTVNLNSVFFDLTELAEKKEDRLYNRIISDSENCSNYLCKGLHKLDHILNMNLKLIEDFKNDFVSLEPEDENAAIANNNNTISDKIEMEVINKS